MKTFTLEKTKHPRLFRVMDREGNWKHYFLANEVPEEEKPIGPGVYLRGSTTILQEGYVKGQGFEEWLLKITPQERDEILKFAGERGDKIHRFIDTALMASGSEEFGTVFKKDVGIFNRITKDYDKPTNDEWDAILSFGRFWAAHEPVLYVSEAPFFSVANGYAGTGDAIIKITKACPVRYCKCEDLVGKIGLWDWKSGSGIRPSFSAQTGSYAHADNIHEYIGPKDAIEYTGILRIGTAHKTTGGYEMKACIGPEMEEGFDRFLAAKKIADFGYKPFDPTIDIEDIPDEVEIVVNRFDLEAALKEAAKPETPKVEKPVKAKKPRAKKLPSKKQKKLL